jgi:hypothetical protein
VIATPAGSRWSTTKPARELGDVSKKARIAELEWEHQRKQLLETIDSESRNLFLI